jgi:hypothetical protein
VEGGEVSAMSLLFRILVIIWVSLSAIAVSSPLTRLDITSVTAIILSIAAFFGSIVIILITWFIIAIFDSLHDQEEYFLLDCLLVLIVYCLAFYLNLQLGVGLR